MLPIIRMNSVAPPDFSPAYDATRNRKSGLAQAVGAYQMLVPDSLKNKISGQISDWGSQLQGRDPDVAKKFQAWVATNKTMSADDKKMLLASGLSDKEMLNYMKPAETAPTAGEVAVAETDALPNEIDEAYADFDIEKNDGEPKMVTKTKTVKGDLEQTEPSVDDKGNVIAVKKKLGMGEDFDKIRSEYSERWKLPDLI